MLEVIFFNQFQVSIPYRQARYSSLQLVRIVRVQRFNSLQVGQVPKVTDLDYVIYDCFNSLQVGQVLKEIKPKMYRQNEFQFLIGRLGTQKQLVFSQHMTSFNSLQVGQVLNFLINLIASTNVSIPYRQARYSYFFESKVRVIKVSIPYRQARYQDLINQDPTEATSFNSLQVGQVRKPCFFYFL